MIRRLKRVLRNIIEARGYAVRPMSMFGVSMEADLARLIRERETPMIIDVGANAGQWLTAIKRTFPNARVLCFEPDSRAFAQLRNTAANLSSVECVQCALGHEPGRLQFFRNVNSVTSSLLPTAAATSDLPYIEALQPLDQVEVEVRTLSSELARRGLDRVDLLKTDCQGFDLRVLQGAAAEIERGDIHLITTEVLFHREYENQSWFYETMPWLLERGFFLVGIYGVMHDERGRMLFGDALFVRES
jgi:FkbM family methyltransferase